MWQLGMLPVSVRVVRAGASPQDTPTSPTQSPLATKAPQAGGDPPTFPFPLPHTGARAIPPAPPNPWGHQDGVTALVAWGPGPPALLALGPASLFPGKGGWQCLVIQAKSRQVTDWIPAGKK